jgi:hypothetical protein
VKKLIEILNLNYEVRMYHTNISGYIVEIYRRLDELKMVGTYCDESIDVAIEEAINEMKKD